MLVLYMKLMGKPGEPGNFDNRPQKIQGNFSRRQPDPCCGQVAMRKKVVWIVVIAVVVVAIALGVGLGVGLTQDDADKEYASLVHTR